MSQSIRKNGRTYIIKFYSPRWGQNAFYQGKEDAEPRYAKRLMKAKEYLAKRNAKVVAGQLTELTGIKHSLGVRF